MKHRWRGGCQLGWEWLRKKEIGEVRALLVCQALPLALVRILQFSLLCIADRDPSLRRWDPLSLIMMRLVRVQENIILVVSRSSDLHIYSTSTQHSRSKISHQNFRKFVYCLISVSKILSPSIQKGNAFVLLTFQQYDYDFFPQKVWPIQIWTNGALLKWIYKILGPRWQNLP